MVSFYMKARIHRRNTSMYRILNSLKSQVRSEDPIKDLLVGYQLVKMRLNSFLNLLVIIMDLTSNGDVFQKQSLISAKLQLSKQK